LALGAGRISVVQYTLRGAFVRVLVGLGLAVVAGRLISNQLYGVSFRDPLALSVAAVALAVCSLVAAMIPLGVAASIPDERLRAE